VYDRRVRLTALALFSLAACTPHGGNDINDVTHSLLREWDNADPTVMPSYLAILDGILASKMLGPNGAGNDRLLALDPPQAGDIVALQPNPGRDPAMQLGGGVARQSQWPIDDFARLQVDPNQVPIEPTAAAYVRTYVDPTDPSCLVGSVCSTIYTSNQITRSNPALQITFTLNKDFRWFTLTDGRRVLAARSWEPTTATNGSNILYQTYGIDIFIEEPGPLTWRWQATFNETQTSIATTTDIAVATITSAVDGALTTADKVIGTRYHGL
jgi:hypothetical protein